MFDFHCTRWWCILPSCDGVEKNSTSAARLIKKSFKKNSASFRERKIKKKWEMLLFENRKNCNSVKCNSVLMQQKTLYLVNIEAKRRKWNTQAALLWSMVRLWTHVQSLHCQLRKKRHPGYNSVHTLSWTLQVWWLSHHVRMGFSGHFLARIQVEELVHLWGS